MSNFFSSPAFLGCAAEALFPGQRHAAETVAVAGRHFDVLRVGRHLQTTLPFMDFLEPIAATTAQREVSYLPRVGLDSVAVEAWEASENSAWEAAPWIDWSRFDEFELFQSYAHKRSSRAFKGNGYFARRMERDLGELRFCFDDDDKKAVELCLDWKSAQYRASGFMDALAAPQLRALFHLLFERKQLTVSTLYAGERPVALHLGALWQGRFYYWLPAYDASLAKFSAGTVLLEMMLEESHRAEHEQFDFLLGDERYKFAYATDVRRVAALGRPPLRQRAWGQLRGHLVPRLRGHQRLYQLLQRAKRLALEQRARLGRYS